MSELSARISGRAGRLTLDRPQALNALTLAMIDAMAANLAAWAHDDRVAVVAIDAVGGKAFCAGGDIQALYQAMTSGDLQPARDFFRREYRLDRTIARYAKPVVALMHGIVIGGGVGVSAHAAHRIVTERTLLALPECSIGLVPDVGATLLLGRAPGHLGEYIGLTGLRLNTADTLATGFADRFVPAARLPGLVAALEAEGDPAVISGFAEPSPHPSALLERRVEIDAIFSAASLAEIVERLDRSTATWAATAREAIAKASPMALHCTLSAIRSSRSVDTIEAALSTEFRFALNALSYGDFAEGIRAAIIDKDRAPRWRDASLSAVSPDAVRTMLAGLGSDDLTFEEEHAR